MCRATASISAGEVSNSGKPCERLMAPSSLAMRVITAKMLTPLAGSLDCSVRRDDTPNDTRLFHPRVRAEGHERISPAQRDHAVVIADSRDLLANQPVAQPPQLEAVEVVDEVVHELGRRGRG